MAIEYVEGSYHHWDGEWKIKVNICDGCGWRVEDLENCIDIEWRSENDCGCLE